MIRFAHPALLFLLAAVAVMAGVEFRRLRRRSPHEPGKVAFVFRAAVLGLAVVATAGPEVVTSRRGSAVLFLVDLSMSVRARSESEAVETINAMIETMGDGDLAGVIVFGDGAALDVGAGRIGPLEGFGAIVDASGTDIEGAILLGLSSFPMAGSRRIVLFTDGIETTGSAGAAAAAAARLGVPIDVVPLREESDRIDTAIIGADAPFRVKAGEPFDITVSLHSSSDVDAQIHVLRDGMYLGEDRIALSPGDQTITWTTLIDTGGVHQYHFYLESDRDDLPQNNEYRLPVIVEGAPSLLYVANPEEPSRAFIEALQTQGMSIEEIDVSRLPDTLAGFIGYDAIIFDDISAFELSFAKMELIERFVRDLAGGFLMLGGDSSFGLGGYLGTPIERLLPVSMDVTSAMDIPSLALLLVIDKSGSMGETISSGETKLDLVKEAVIASIEVLNPYYTVGLLSFDADFEWTVPLTRAGNRDEVVRDLATLAPGGGTQLFPAMNTAFETLEATDAAVKHLLILSDGLTDDGEFRDLVEAMAAKRITVSTIAVGADADRELLAMIAELGGGRSYFTDDIERVPRIFASESIIVSRGLIIEERFLPLPGAPAELLEGIDLFALPPLDGFVLAYAKPAATTVLEAFGGNPLLATWRYGLGKSAAFTSDLKGRWGSSWVAWEELPRFAAQLLRALQRPAVPGTLAPVLTVAGDSGLLSVDAIDEAGDFRNSLELEAVILDPGGETETVALEQVAPGRYETRFTAGDEGEYFAALRDTASSGSPVTAFLSLPYPREFLPATVDSSLLSTIAEVTGGAILPSLAEGGSAASWSNLFASPGESRAYTPVWRLFLVAALVLFTIDIARRQLSGRKVRPSPQVPRPSGVNESTRK